MSFMSGLMVVAVSQAMGGGSINVMVRFGKNNVKFVAKGKCTLIAVGEIVGGRIKIFTVVEGN